MADTNLRVVDRDIMDRSANDKSKALEAALSQIERAHGKGSIMKLGEGATPANAEAVSTGSIGLDIALGIGGVPKGRIVEIYGPESSGKTTLALHIVAEAQKKGGTCAFIDAEHALDPIYARKLHVDIEELLISQPDAGEQALEIADTLVRSGAIDVIVIDSVAALVPRAELEGEMGDTHVGLQARLMSQALRKLTGSINRSQCLIIFINQMGELVDLGVKAGIVEKSGSWFSYGDQRIGQGRENAKSFLLENPDLTAQLEKQILEHSGVLGEAALTDPAGNADNAEEPAE